jgi:environmental stress-induced protein Ves
MRRRIEPGDLHPTPWKNGGGMTTELVTGGDRAGPDGWSWRISMADVAQDGPFSPFPGVDRLICVVEGEGMDLLFQDGMRLPLERDRVMAFPGDVPAQGRLREGPVRDFNLMANRARHRIELSIGHGVASTVRGLGPGEVMLIHALEGPCVVSLSGGKPETLDPGVSLLLEGEARVAWWALAGARVAVATIRPA